MLSTFRESAALAYGRYVAQTIPPEKSSDSLLIGSLVHLLILEPDKWDAEVEEVDARDKRAKAYKTATQDYPDKLIALAPDVERAKQIARSVLEPRTPDAELARDLLIDSPGVSEYSHRWTDAATGVPLKVRFDRVTETAKGPTDVSLKTAADPSKSAFWRALWRYGYHIQAALYGEGFADLTAQEPDTIFVVVRNQAPFEVAVYLASPELIAKGREQLRKDLSALAACRLSDGPWMSEWETHVHVL